MSEPNLTCSGNTLYRGIPTRDALAIIIIIIITPLRILSVEMKPKGFGPPLVRWEKGQPSSVVVKEPKWLLRTRTGDLSAGLAGLIQVDWTTCDEFSFKIFSFYNLITPPLTFTSSPFDVSHSVFNFPPNQTYVQIADDVMRRVVSLNCDYCHATFRYSCSNMTSPPNTQHPAAHLIPSPFGRIWSNKRIAILVKRMRCD